MQPLRVWYNENLSSTHNIVRLLREAGDVHVLCTHRNLDCPAFELADEPALEPDGLDPDAYLAWCLKFCRDRGVEVFVPGRGMVRAAEPDARAAYAAAGVGLVLAADAETMRLFDDKARFYRTVPEAVAPAPAFQVVNHVTGFEEAHRALTDAGHRVCFKPSRSTGGLGFHILDDRRDELRNLFNSEPVRLAPATATRILTSQPEFRDLLVMEYLDGAEYSVDCLGAPDGSGRLLRAVVRRKPTRTGGAQFLEDRPDLIALAGRAARHYRLGGIFNVQVRCATADHNRPKLLEINPRMSGGLYMACLSGVNFPWWATQLAAGRAREEDIPMPRTGFKVQQQLREFILENPVARGEQSLPTVPADEADAIAPGGKSLPA